MLNRRAFFAGAAALGSQAAAQRPGGRPGSFQTAEPAAMFRGENNIREEDHFGIINGHITVGVNYRNVAGIGGMYAPPYASTDFLLEMRINGTRVPTSEYSWTPVEVRRRGRIGDLEVATETLLLHGQRSGILAVTLTNHGAATQVPLQFEIGGSFDRVAMWGFPRPQTQKQATTAEADANRVIRSNSAGAFAIACNARNLTMGAMVVSLGDARGHCAGSQPCDPRSIRNGLPTPGGGSGAGCPE